MGGGCNDTSNIVTNTWKCWNCLKNLLLLSFTDGDGDGLWRKSRKALDSSLQTGWRKPSQISGWVAITLQMIDFWLYQIYLPCKVRVEWESFEPVPGYRSRACHAWGRNGLTVLGGLAAHIPDTDLGEAGPGQSLEELKLIPHRFYKKTMLGFFTIHNNLKNVKFSIWSIHLLQTFLLPVDH